MIALPNPFESAPVQVAESAVVSSQPLSGADATADHRFVLDEAAFLNDIEPLPAFLLNPSPEYLRANDMIPMLAVLAGH